MTLEQAIEVDMQQKAVSERLRETVVYVKVRYKSNSFILKCKSFIFPFISLFRVRHNVFVASNRMLKKQRRLLSRD